MSDPALEAIAAFALVAADLAGLVRFYRDVLGFALHGGATQIDPAEIALLGLSGAGRRQILGLGDQILWIDQFEPAGRSYPADTDAAALCFQHLALVVDDIHAAHGRLRDATFISQGGTQRLPASSGGVQAFKFRDPDGHPLELLQFAPGDAPAAWRNRRRAARQIGLGIDHSAISVADADASAAFYAALGLGVGGRTLNAGPAQQALDGLAGVEVTVIPMNPPCGTPHLELLGYHAPRGRAGPALRADDEAATRIVWHGREARSFSDPDGHLQQVRTHECPGDG